LHTAYKKERTAWLFSLVHFIRSVRYYSIVHWILLHILYVCSFNTNLWSLSS